jgi:hypothetical protein
MLRTGKDSDGTSPVKLRESVAVTEHHDNRVQAGAATTRRAVNFPVQPSSRKFTSASDCFEV